MRRLLRDIFSFDSSREQTKPELEEAFREIRRASHDLSNKAASLHALVEQRAKSLALAQEAIDIVHRGEDEERR
jgi:hypothetical protein